MTDRILLLSALLATAFPGLTSAMVLYQVDTTDDATSGACHSMMPADCPLRRALILANGDGDDSVVVVPAGLYQLTIPGSGELASATGDLNVGVGDDDLTIEAVVGSAPVIEQTTDDRVLQIGVTSEGGDGTLTVRGLTLRGGDSSGAGGGIQVYQPGGDGSPGPGWPLVLIEDSIVELNHASYGGGIAITPGFPSGGFQVVIRRTEVRENMASNGAGLAGGTIFGSVTVEASRFLDNVATGSGGGMSLNALSQSIQDTLISGNHADGHAGGVHSPTGDVFFARNAVVGNSAGTSGGSGATGGGILVCCGEHAMEVDNSTVADNVLLGASPAGRQIAVSGRVQLDLEHTTLAAAPGDEAFPVLELLTRDMTIELRNTALDGGCSFVDPASMVTYGYNVERPWDGTTSTTCNLDPVGTGDVVTTDLVLGPTAIHGGPWGLPTREPLAGSPAIFRVPSTDCLPEDQRQAPRSSLFCDAGAHESMATAPGEWIFADGFESGGAMAWGSSGG